LSDLVREKERKLRPASSLIIHKTIGRVYDEADKTGRKPPNVKEIVAPVQKRLNAAGFEASGRRIQLLAEADKYKSRRRKPGRTISSDLRREK
jgi:hypothetical protein